MNHLQEHEEQEEADEAKTCKHPFHQETCDDGGGGSWDLIKLADPIINMMEAATTKDGEERDEELNAQRVFEAERCPRCGKRHDLEA